MPGEAWESEERDDRGRFSGGGGGGAAAHAARTSAPVKAAGTKKKIAPAPFGGAPVADMNQAIRNLMEGRPPTYLGPGR